MEITSASLETNNWFCSAMLGIAFFLTVLVLAVTPTFEIPEYLKSLLPD
jgi:hypothetical protein